MPEPCTSNDDTRDELILYQPHKTRTDIWTLMYLQYRWWNSQPTVTYYDGTLSEMIDYTMYLSERARKCPSFLPTRFELKFVS